MTMKPNMLIKQHTHRLVENYLMLLWSLAMITNISYQTKKLCQAEQYTVLPSSYDLAVTLGINYRFWHTINHCSCVMSMHAWLPALLYHACVVMWQWCNSWFSLTVSQQLMLSRTRVTWCMKANTYTSQRWTISRCAHTAQSSASSAD